MSCWCAMIMRYGKFAKEIHIAGVAHSTSSIDKRISRELHNSTASVHGLGKKTREARGGSGKSDWWSSVNNCVIKGLSRPRHLTAWSEKISIFSAHFHLQKAIKKSEIINSRSDSWMEINRCARLKPQDIWRRKVFRCEELSGLQRQSIRSFSCHENAPSSSISPSSDCKTFNTRESLVGVIKRLQQSQQGCELSISSISNRHADGSQWA